MRSNYYTCKHDSDEPTNQHDPSKNDPQNNTFVHNSITYYHHKNNANSHIACNFKNLDNPSDHSHFVDCRSGNIYTNRDYSLNYIDGNPNNH